MQQRLPSRRYGRALAQLWLVPGPLHRGCIQLPSAGQPSLWAGCGRCGSCLPPPFRSASAASQPSLWAGCFGLSAAPFTSPSCQPSASWPGHIGAASGRHSVPLDTIRNNLRNSYVRRQISGNLYINRGYSSGSGHRLKVSLIKIPISVICCTTTKNVI